jgi:hypothetical protein
MNVQSVVGKVTVISLFRYLRYFLVTSDGDFYSLLKGFSLLLFDDVENTSIYISISLSFL